MNIRASGLAVAAALAALALLPSSASGAFSHGVAAGDVTSDGAILWTRADRTGRVLLEVAHDRRFRRMAARRRLRARSSDDKTVQTRIRRLRPGRTYWYRFRQGRRRSPRGEFRTAPRSNSRGVVEFAYSGDADATPGPNGRPFYDSLGARGFGVYDRMRRERNHFNIILGDTIYSDSSVPGAVDALSLRRKWAKYRLHMRQRNLARLRRSGGTYSHWDDHEFVNDFSVPENGRTLYRNGVRAFRDYNPVTYSSRNGLYRTVRWGRTVELFFLDLRSFRDAKASAGGTCDNPQTGEPDLAPTAPARTRATFAALIPSFGAPVSQACLDRINDPSRTLMGARQLAAFQRAVRRSRAVWKIVVNEVPIQQFYALPYDRWEGFAHERRQLLEFLMRNVRNVVFVTTDTHANFVNDARLQTLEEGGAIDSGIKEHIAGPVATNTFAREIDEVTGTPGNGQLVSDAFFEPDPPDGVGMECSASDVFSYAQVKATRSSLTITHKDVNGRVVREPGDGGRRCGPFRMRAR